MTFDFNSYHKLNKLEDYEGLCKKIKCKDGFSISAQASHFHHCIPRENNAEFYTHIELGFPSDRLPAHITEKAENPHNLLYTVYPRIPVEWLNELIDSHGGVE